MTTKEETTMEEEVKDPNGLLAAYNNLKEEVRKLSAERDELSKAKAALEDAAKEDAWRTRALLAETKSALTAQGIKDVDKVLKYVSTEGLDFDESGNLVGLDDRLKEWKADLPAVFDPKTRAGGKADIFADGTVEPQVDPFREAVRGALSG